MWWWFLCSVEHTSSSPSYPSTVLFLSTNYLHFVLVHFLLVGNSFSLWMENKTEERSNYYLLLSSSRTEQNKMLSVHPGNNLGYWLNKGKHLDNFVAWKKVLSWRILSWKIGRLTVVSSSIRWHNSHFKTSVINFFFF